MTCSWFLVLVFNSRDEIGVNDSARRDLFILVLNDRTEVGLYISAGGNVLVLVLVVAVPMVAVPD